MKITFFNEKSMLHENTLINELQSFQGQGEVLFKDKKGDSPSACPFSGYQWRLQFLKREQRLNARVSFLFFKNGFISWRNNVHFGGMIAQLRNFFHIYVNERFILEEIGEMLNGKTYVNESFTLMRGFQYKDKEGVEMFLGKATLMWVLRYRELR